MCLWFLILEQTSSNYDISDNGSDITAVESIECMEILKNQ